MKKVATPNERLKSLAKELPYTKGELAKKMGVSESVFSKILSNKYTPSNEAIERFAKALNVSEIYLLGFDVPIYFDYVNNKEELKTPKAYLLKRINQTLKKYDLEDLRKVSKILNILFEEKYNGETKSSKE